MLFRKQPRVTYTYAVNGAPYTSQRISFAAGFPPRETDAILSRYPVGQEVTVAHSPNNPAEATLETGSNRQVTMEMRVLLICFVLIVVTQILTYCVRRAEREKQLPRRTYGAAAIVVPERRA